MTYPLLPGGDNGRRYPDSRLVVYPSNPNHNLGGYHPRPSTAESAPVTPSLLSFRVWWRYKWLFAILITFGATIGYLFAKSQMPVYQAKLTFEVQNVNENFMNLRDVDPTINGSAAESLQTQLKILKSDALLSRVRMKMADWQERMTERHPVRPAGILSHLPANKPVTFNGEMGAAGDRLRVGVAGLSRVVDVRFDSADPQFAAEFVNTLVKEYIDLNLEYRWSSNQQTSEWLAKNLEEMRQKLERDEQRLQTYAKSANLVYMDGKDSVSEAKLRQLQTELSAATADRVNKQAKYELAKNSPADSIPDVLADAAVKDLKAKLAELRRQKAEQSAALTAEHPKVKRLDLQIEQLTATLNSAQATIVRSMSNEFEAARLREQMLESAYRAQTSTVTDESGKSIQYDILKREVNTTRVIYESMLQKVKEARLATFIKPSNIRILDAASVPDRPYKPSLMQLTGAGVLLGFLIASAVVIQRERPGRFVKAPGEASYFLELPELGVIPAAPGVENPLGTGKRSGILGLLGSDSTPQGDLVVSDVSLRNRPQWVAETFGVALTSIMLRAGQSKAPQTILVTSPSPGEGKSTTITNLGIQWAGMRCRTLLIDADMRRPRQHVILGLENSWGLTDFIEETKDVESYDLDTLVRPTGIPNLSIVSAGTAVENVAALLLSPRLPKLLERLRREFDVILIDTPPVLHIPDVRILARSVDSVVLVLRSSKTSLEAARAARNVFAQDGTPILGTILNGWDPRTSSSGYKYYDNHYKAYFNDSKRR